MLIILLLTAAGYYGFNFGAILTQGKQMIPPQLVANEFSHVIDISTEQLSSMTPDGVINYLGERITGGQPHALTPGTFAPDWMNIFALAAGLVFGTAGLPHVLKRYYTVDKPKDARTSTIGVLFAIGIFYIMTVFVGIAAMHLLYPDILGYFLTGEASVAKNMAVPLLGELVGGPALMGIAIGGAFCAILSTTAGLLITIGTTITHDFYGELINKNPSEKKEVFIAKLSIAATGTLAVLLAIALRDQNVSFLVTLAFGIAASVFFPTLFMSVWWKKYTREGAVATMITGLVISVIFVGGNLMGMPSILGIPVLVNPALYSLPAAIIAGILVSFVTDDYGEAKKFMALAHRRKE